MKAEKKVVYKESMMDLPVEKSGSYVHLHCPSCGTESKADNIDLSSKLVKCHACHVVYSAGPVLKKLEMEEAREEVTKPEGVDNYTYKDGFEMEIDQPWSALEIILMSMLPFFVLISTIIYFKKGISYLWPAAAWTAAVYSIISLISRKKHKVFIHIDERYLSLIWKPSKLMPSKKFRTPEIEQVYVSPSNGMHYVKLVTNGLKGQKHHHLIGGFSSPSTARYIEQEIEKYLDIEDRRLPEEKGNSIQNS